MDISQGYIDALCTWVYVKEKTCELCIAKEQGEKRAKKTNEDDESQVYEMFDVVDVRVRKRKREYLERWTGYVNPDDNTWEPESRLQEDIGADKMIEDCILCQKTHSGSLAMYRRLKNKKVRFLSTESGTCVVESIAIAAELLNTKMCMSESQTNFTNLTYSGIWCLVKEMNERQVAMGEKQFIIGGTSKRQWRKSNYIQSSVKDYTGHHI